jgi:tetratricopeptide (TPR) repeat protein
MDQFVLTTSDGLERQLSENLSLSSAGILIWSHRSEDSKWCNDEYGALRNLEDSKPGFRYVVVNLDGADLPLFAKQKLWIDFSAFREGPSGSNLLRLLCGLQGKPLPPEAVSLAADMDDKTQKSFARILALKETGDTNGLVELSTSNSDEWHNSSLLSSKVAEALIALGKNDEALGVIHNLNQEFPKSIRPQQLKGLALARKGNWQEAQVTLLELYHLGERDPETLGILARTWRDRYSQSGDLIYLRKARDIYAEAFKATPSDYYTGINAASNSVLLGELEVAAQYAELVEKLVGIVVINGDYWKTATVAEVQLIRRNFKEAAKLYETAVTMDTEAKASHASTLGQARRLLEKLQTTDEQKALIEKAFGF